MDTRVRLGLEVTNLVATHNSGDDGLLDAAARIICDALAEVCVIAVLSEDRRMLHPLGLYHRDPEQRQELNGAASMAWEPRDELSRRVLKTGRPIRLSPNDIADAARREPWVAGLVARSGLNSATIVAMRASGESIGLLSIARRSRFPPIAAEDLPVLQGIADRLGLVVENLELKEALEQLRNPPRDAESEPAAAGLTSRELEILGFVGEGLTNREIAEHLYLSVRTVEWHRARLSAKLGVHGRSELIAIGRTRQAP